MTTTRVIYVNCNLLWIRWKHYSNYMYTSYNRTKSCVYIARWHTVMYCFWRTVSFVSMFVYCFWRTVICIYVCLFTVFSKLCYLYPCLFVCLLFSANSVICIHVCLFVYCFQQTVICIHVCLFVYCFQQTVICIHVCLFTVFGKQCYLYPCLFVYCFQQTVICISVCLFVYCFQQTVICIHVCLFTVFGKQCFCTYVCLFVSKHRQPETLPHYSSGQSYNRLASLGLHGQTKTAEQWIITIGTLAVDGWTVTFGTARRKLGGFPAHPGPYSLYQMMWHCSCLRTLKG